MHLLLRWRFACVLVLLPLAVASARAEDGPALLSRTYDLGWMNEREALPGTALGFLATLPDRSELSGDDEEGEAEPLLEPEAVATLVRELVRPSLWGGATGAEVSAREGRLVVNAPAEVQAEVGGLLEGLWREAARRVRVEVDVLRLDLKVWEGLPADGLRAALLRGRLKEAEGIDLVERARAGGDVARLSSVVRLGAWARLSQVAVRTWLLDYEVEIADDSVVANPVVARVLTGTALDLRASLLPDGRMQLAVLLDVAEPVEEVRRVDPQAEPFGWLDMPSLRVLRLATSATVAAGESAAVVARTDDDVRVLLLRAVPLDAASGSPRAPGSPATPSSPVRRFDVSSVVGERVATRLVRAEGSDSVPMPGVRMQQVLEDGALGGAEELLDLLRAPGESEAAAPWFIARGQSIWVPAARAAAVQQALDALAVPLSGRERLVLAVREVAADGARAERCVLAFDVQPGLPFAAVHAVERTYLRDWDVEVAQEARVGDPLPGVLGSGLYLTGGLSAGPGAEHALLQFDALLTRQLGAFSPSNPGNACTGMVERAVLEALRAGRDGPMAAGEPVVLVLGNDEAGRRVEVEARLWR